MIPVRTRPEPWRDGDLVVLSVTAFIGMATIGGAWFAASGTASMSTAAGWLNLAVAGLVIAAAGNCLWLLRLRRAVGERRIALVSLDFGADDSVDTDEWVNREMRPATSTADLHLVQVDGTARVHSPDCPLVRGKRVEAATVSHGEPCGVCSR